MPLSRYTKAKIFTHRSIGTSYYRLVLKAPGTAAVSHPGQFVMLRVSETMDPVLARPFGISSLIAKHSIELVYKAVGKGTVMLSRLKSGHVLDMLGPLGNGFDLPAPDARGPFAMVAGGIGVAPLFELMERITLSNPALDPQQINLFYGARTVAELPLGMGEVDLSSLLPAPDVIARAPAALYLKGTLSTGGDRVAWAAMTPESTSTVMALRLLKRKCGLSCACNAESLAQNARASSQETCSTGNASVFCPATLPLPAPVAQKKLGFRPMTFVY